VVAYEYSAKINCLGVKRVKREGVICSVVIQQRKAVEQVPYCVRQNFSIYVGE
jgi:hypothetical protein